MFNILEERDVQIRGYPISFELDVMLLFSANPSTYNRSGKVIPQLKDRIGAVIHTHYPRDRQLGIAVAEQEAAVDLGGDWPVLIPPFMKELIEQITITARGSRFLDQQSGVSARLSIANYQTMVASARQRAVRLGEKPAVPRVSDLAHLVTSSLGKLELDLMGSHQMTEQQVLEGIMADAIATVFTEYVEQHGLDEIAAAFQDGIKIEVGDAVPSRAYEAIVSEIPAVWDKAFEVNPSSDPAVRAACIEFVLAGLHATERISRLELHGRTLYDTEGFR
jgi:magnesium chelatase subunit I